MANPDDLTGARISWEADLAALGVTQSLLDEANTLVGTQAATIADLEARLAAVEEGEPPAPPPTPSGSLLGVNTESDARFRAAYISANGADAPPLVVERIFCQTEGWGAGNYPDVVAAVNAGHVPIVSTKFKVGWASVPTNTSEIARLDKIVDELCKLDVADLGVTPCFVGNHEPENDGPPATDFNKLQTFLASRYGETLRTAGWDLAIILMNGSFFVRANGTTYTPWSRAQLDSALAGVEITKVYADLYEKPGGGEPWATAEVRDPNDPSSTFRGYVDFCTQRNFEMGVCELGVNRRSTDTTGAGPAKFLDSLAVSSLFDDVDFWIYYDRDVGEGGATSNARISQFPLAMKAYARLGA